MQRRSVGAAGVAQNEAAKAIERLAKREAADIYLFSAPISGPRVDRLREIVSAKSPRADTCIVYLTTFGGDADAAYRLAACLRRHYKLVAFYVFGLCKSAGTLALLGADQIVFGDFGELGPLDVQMTKPDELVSTSSGLDIFQAMGVLTNSAFEAFESYFLKIIENSQGHISAKTSAEIARELAVGLFAPMTGQIDPERLGEVQRAITVANVYGSRLNKGNNLKRGALDKLVQGYPTHGFVIDLEEAKTLFNNVRHADPLENEVAKYLPGLRRQGPEPYIHDVRQQLGTTGAKNGANAKTRRPRRTVPAPDGGRPGNVAQLRGNAASHAEAADENHNTRRNSAKTVRPSLKPPPDAAAGG